MAINYGIVHPDFQENAAKILQTEVNLLAIPIKKRRFTKANNIDSLDFTAQALSIISQYLLSLVYLLSGNIEKAYVLLSKLHSKAENGNEAASRFNIDSLVRIRLFEVCMASTRECYDLFYREKSSEALIKLNNKLEEANKLFPNTYDYFLGKAYYLVAFSLDVDGARKCINECRQFRTIKTWKYSEAFLSAFNHNSPNTIIRKYIDAFKAPEDLLRIADYIEYIIEKVPDHMDLHLAAALVYDQIEETVLASEHFRLYLETDAGKKIAEFIRRKMSTYPPTDTMN